MHERDTVHMVHLIFTRLMRGTRRAALVGAEAVAICLVIRLIWGGPIESPWFGIIVFLGTLWFIGFGALSLLAFTFARLARPEEPDEA